MVNKIVCSPEQATELKRLGIKQSSIFYYDCKEIGRSSRLLVCAVQHSNNSNLLYTPFKSKVVWKDDSTVSAYTVTELAPVISYIYANNIHIQIPQKYDNMNEADAIFTPDFIADIILYALNNNLITVEMVNSLMVD